MEIDTTTIKMPEEWSVAGKKNGSQEMLSMPVSFGLCGSSDEALFRVERRLAGDAAFREKFRGWTFYPIRVDKAIEITHNGIVQIYKNERQTVIA